MRQNFKDYKCKECRIVEKEKSDEWTTKSLAIPREVNGVMNIIITSDRQSKKGDTKCNQQDNVDNQQYNYLQFINETRMIVLGLSFFLFL